MDEIPSSHSDRDIRSYICYQLRDIGDPDALNDDEVDKFVRMADGLFEWARLACEFVKIRKGDQGPKERYSNLVLRATGGKDLLDTMYAIILKDVIEPTPRALARFRSVMRQVLWASEPLPFDSLNAFRRTFRVESDRYDVGIILAVMAPLLSGIINKAAPVRALHSSFYEFLTDALRSEEFFVEKSDVHSNMAFASLQVMKKGLRFNICDLETSYLANSEVLDMDQRIMRNIPHYLSYSCRFWGSHLQETVLCKWLVEEVHAFFDSEKVLFWLEALSLLNAMKHAVANLSASEKWVLVSNMTI
ncbi:hypothetical protein ID866_9314 [Astraeus odoratus]|nr:hypothetical protein ID866_9314 [Astraeus odoratus]